MPQPFVKKFGLRTFPALFLYPAHSTSPSFLPIAYHANRTKEDYKKELLTFAVLAQPVTDDLYGLHDHVLDFMKMQVCHTSIACSNDSVYIPRAVASTAFCTTLYSVLLCAASSTQHRRFGIFLPIGIEIP